VLCELAPVRDPNVLVSAATKDDAAVYRLDENTALVQSVDVFTPVVDDPYDFGQVAAANALSDIYAMGARPLTALSVIGFPVGRLPLSVMVAILRGGEDKAREAGIDVVGGHSLDDAEPKYGLCVTGVVHPARVVTNAGARPGDRLVLTKPLGIGILTHALKQGLLSLGEVKQVTELMALLNRAASDAMVRAGVSACTDVTGYGFLGHLGEMLDASGVSARIRVGDVPVLPGARDRVVQGVCPGGTRKNLAYVTPNVIRHERVAEPDLLLLADAQTSGGLLIAVPGDRLDDLLHALRENGVETRAVIGEILAGNAGRIVLDAG